ncbi:MULTISPECIES: hypothetical protein [Rhizobiaceae]|jgi:hypothetical protein|uniref:Alkaline proteinase inhibitor/ Outer membrane lipoprotein Omp19 domain-containing protein n=1 Tax=Peteryoungia algae TaxID=2919917 RepID=A0ABT0CYG8_9HYPH|nr:MULTISPECIES: hypothetical protein [unclassified Rhizobium]MCC8932524.1 hypothetical protein [Rhizobium sp. 'Codium 1']MCJ8238187.1 hypothetical protein [Rhizobium sp. SSM4.3]
MKSSFVIVATALSCACISAVGITFWSAPQQIARDAADPIVLGTIPDALATGRPVALSMYVHSASPPAIFSVSNFTLKTVCLVERGAALTSRSRDFFAPPDCDEVWPGLARASNWTQNEDGSVSISDANGATLLTLVRGRHFSYEASDAPGADLALLMLP